MDDSPPTPPPPPDSQPPMPPAFPTGQVLPPPQPPLGPLTAEEKQMAMWRHLASLAGYLVPFGNVIGPLIVWLTKRETMPFVDQEGKESVNFQISVTIYALASFALVFFCIGIPLLIAVGIFGIVFAVLASMESSKGNAYRYPLCIRFIN
ncbi:MAG TPA: DUF4870 domain-containing protein [Candidatus Saccharimonadia bacterium]|nr:DUF4870 domain-containing protein [Candidatus Saccharimonadia bacterium]